MRRFVAVLLVLIMVSTMFYGTAYAAEPYTIKMLSIWSDSDETGEAYVWCKIAQAYCEQHEGFDYEYEFCEQFDVSSKMAILIASNDVPDLFSYEPGGAMDDLVKADAVVNMSQDLEKYTGYKLDDIYSDLSLQITRDAISTEDLYNLPMKLQVEGIFYSKPLFEDKGYEVPTTWDEMMALCDQMIADGIQPFSMGGYDEWQITRWIMAYACRQKDYDVHFDASKAQNGRTFSDDYMIEAYKMLQTFCEKGYFGKGYNSVDNPTMLSMFLNHQVAMMYNIYGDNFTEGGEGELQEDEIGFFNIPVVTGTEMPEEAQKATFAVNCSLAICFGKEKAEAGTNNDFLRYWLENYGREQSEIGSIPCFTEEFLGQPITMSGLQEEVYTQVLDNCKYSTQWWEATMDTNTSNIALENGQLLAEGSMTAEAYGEAQDLGVAERYE